MAVSYAGCGWSMVKVSRSRRPAGSWTIYDLRRLFTFLPSEGMDCGEFRGSDALRLLAFLRRAPSRRPTQRLGLTMAVRGPEAPGSLLAPATVKRILAAVSSFYDWAVVAEEYDGDSPMQGCWSGSPRRTPEITACRHDKPTAHLGAAGRGAIADLGFVGPNGGADTDPAVITGYKAARNRPLTRRQKLSNKALAAIRAPVEHGFAHLKNWRVLGKVHTDPKWATALVRALPVLTNRDVSR
ncbi:transposase family protein [Streptomyces sp. NPDC005538]|uniref:transposase family protein n=1 Tax=unclassified Streptomyces TaxID=2593676 RepID=UPI0033B0D0EF